MYINNNFKAVLFDLDGTLYSSRKMQLTMLIVIFLHILSHPTDLKILRIIHVFRKEREKRAGEKYVAPQFLEDIQYTWAADVLGIKPGEVREVISKWMYEIPLKYLPKTMFTSVFDILQKLDHAGIKYAVVSDYPAQEKLQAMHITMPVVVAATDHEVNALKPCPRGFLYAAQQLDVMLQDCLVVGDRYDRDGSAALAAGMQYCQSLIALKKLL